MLLLELFPLPVVLNHEIRDNSALLLRTKFLTEVSAFLQTIDLSSSDVRWLVYRLVSIGVTCWAQDAVSLLEAAAFGAFLGEQVLETGQRL